MARWTALLAVLAALKTQPAAAQSLRELVTRWATEGGWKNSKNLADAILRQDLSYPDPKVKEALTDLANSTKSNGTETLPPEEKGNATLTPYLNATEASNITTGGPLPEGNYTVGISSPPKFVNLTNLKSDGTVYKYDGKEFELNTWSNKGADGATISTSDGKKIDVPSIKNATFEVVSEPSEEEEEEEVGGRRRKSRKSRKSRKQRRKTLRRKK